MRLLSFAASATLIASFVSTFPRDARAFQCTAVTNARPALTQAWNQRCIPYYIDRRGTLIAGDAGKQLIAQSFRVWSGNACTDLEFVDAGETDLGASFDPKHPSQNQNVIVSIEDPNDLDAFPQDGLLAITLTSYSVETGEIFDADILLNGVDFDFGDVGDPRNCMLGRMAYDLRNTLIHEMGHFIGFDHEVDRESTMFASAEKCEIKKRDLSDDDRLGLCTVYPKDQPTMTCAPPPGGYDSGAGCADEFRCQCGRAVAMGPTDCTCAVACTCVEAVQTEPPPATQWIGFALGACAVASIGSLVGWRKRRKISGR